MKQRLLLVIAAVAVLGSPAWCPEGARAETAAGGGQEDPRVTLVTNGWVEVGSILSEVASNAGLGLQLAPDATGKVNVHLENVPLPSALAAILEPINLGWEILSGALIVYKEGMVTRWLSFDYPVTKREGRGELLVSAGTGGGESGGGGGGGEGGGEENESHVTTTVIMSVWPQIIQALQTLVFPGEEVIGGVESDGDGIAASISDTHGRTLVVNPMAGLIQVTAEWSRVERAATLLGSLEESLRRQVAIEVQILEVTLRDTDRTGIDWTVLAGQPDFGTGLATTEGLENPGFSFVVNGTDAYGVMEMISEQGTIKVLSTPRITTLNNQKAVVRVVVEEVFFEAMVEPAVLTDEGSTNPVVEYSPRIFPVGIVLDVTPQIGKDRMVTLNVHPTITDIVRVETSPNEDTQPVLSVRELDTVGMVKDGETLVIAGLMSEGLKKTDKGIPLLKSIPLLGYFFKRSYREKTKTELVMLLSPVILDEARMRSSAETAKQLIKDRM